MYIIISYFALSSRRQTSLIEWAGVSDRDREISRLSEMEKRMKNIIIQLYYIINTNSRACERPLTVSGKRATAAFVTSRKLLRRRNQACQGRRRRRRGIVFHVTLDRSRTPPQWLRIPAMQARPGCNTPTAAVAASRTTERIELGPVSPRSTTRSTAVVRHITHAIYQSVAPCTGLSRLHRRRDAAVRGYSWGLWRADFRRRNEHNIPIYYIIQIVCVFTVVYDWHERRGFFHESLLIVFQSSCIIRKNR